MSHAIVVLVLGVNCGNCVETVSASKLDHFVFVHAEAAHRFGTRQAQVHLVADELTQTTALIMNERSLVRSQFKH